MDFSPLRYKVFRALAGHQPISVFKAANTAWEIAPACERLDPPAIYHPDDLNLIRGYQEHTNADREHAKIQGGKKAHGASVMYRFDNVIVRGGYAYCGKGRLRMSGAGEGAWLSVAPMPTLDQGMLVGHDFAARYFGHWLMDQLPHELIAHDKGFQSIAVPHDGLLYHEPGYRLATGLELDVRPACRIRSMLYVKDCAQNDYKRQRYLQMRARIQDRFSEQEPLHSNGVYIMRHTQGARRILENEQEIARRCRQWGLIVLDPSMSSVSEMYAALQGASIVIGVEGSALCHALMCSPIGTTIVAIQPPYRFNNITKDFADCVGMHYGFTVADPAGKGCFKLPVDRLERVLELVNNEMEATKQQLIA